MVNNVISAGIDIGSVMTKCVLVSAGEARVRTLGKTGPRPEETAKQVFEQALRQAGLEQKNVGQIVTTGYGRRLFGGAQKIVTEISAAAAGAHECLGRKACLILDVGGQDTKIIDVDGEGRISDFLMNDKCAAGTGRFLELMAGVFETDCAGLSALALKAAAPAVINSTCSVFAESEVISLIAHGAGKENIAAGLFAAIAGRIAVMLGHFNLEKQIIFCGGGAKSAALKTALEKAAGITLTIAPHPQFLTAYGAALPAGGS
jgi:predicted CoA-substrate-specific enzyme activase